MAKNSKFHYFFSNFGRNIQIRYTNLRDKIWCVLSEEISFVTSIGPHVTENEKKMTQIQVLKFHNSLNIFDRNPAQEYA